MLFCAVVSTIGRSSAKLRRSPLTLYCRAGNVTFRPPAAAPFPDGEADQLAGRRVGLGEVQFGVGELAGRVALVVRRNLDGHGGTLLSVLALERAASADDVHVHQADAGASLISVRAATYCEDDVGAVATARASKGATGAAKDVNAVARQRPKSRTWAIASASECVMVSSELTGADARRTDVRRRRGTRSCGGPPRRTTSTPRHEHILRVARCRAPSSRLPSRRIVRRNESRDGGAACSTRFRLR